MCNNVNNSQSTAAENSASKCIVNALEKSLKKINKIENSDNPMFSGWVKVKEDVRIAVYAGRCYDAETQTYAFGGTFTLESKNHKGVYTDDVDCLVGVTSTERMTDEQCVALIIDEFKKKLSDWMGSKYEILARNAYVLNYCYFGGAKNDAPSLEQAPSLENDYTIEEVCDGFYEIVFNDDEDDEITDEGYSVAGLNYLRENMVDADMEDIVDEAYEEVSNDLYVWLNELFRCGECPKDEFMDTMWAYAWDIIRDRGLSDEALEAETRYYTEFDDIVERRLEEWGLYERYNKIYMERAYSNR